MNQYENYENYGNYRNMKFILDKLNRIHSICQSLWNDIFEIQVV